MAYPMPISARDLIEFRPNSEAVIKAREAVEKAQADINAALTAENGGPDSVTDEIKAALEDAEKALAAAEEAREKADPVFMLRVPNGRTKAIFVRDINADPDMPKYSGNKELVTAALTEADSLDPAEVQALNDAAQFFNDGKDAPESVWRPAVEAANKTAAGRSILADRYLFGELSGRHRIRHHLVIDGVRNPLPEHEIDRIEDGYLGAINAKLIEMTELSKDAAKN